MIFIKYLKLKFNVKVIMCSNVFCILISDFTCDQCQRKYRNCISLKKHRLYYCGQQFGCDLCQGVFTRKATLQLHKAVKHGVLME